MINPPFEFSDRMRKFLIEHRHLCYNAINISGNLFIWTKERDMEARDRNGFTIYC